MNARQLQIFSAVVEHASFSKAASALNVAQPAVSIAIKKLEEALDTVLLNRVSKTVSLTPEGKILLKHAGKILAQLDEAKLELQELKGLVKGEVSIAMPAMHAAYYFPETFNDFMQAYPELRILVREEGTREVERDLLSGKIDLGVVTIKDASQGLEIHPLVDEEMVACVAADHAFLKQGKLKMEDFLQEPLVMVRAGYFLRETIDSAAERLEITPNIVFETNLMRLIKKLVMNGKGVSTCLRFVLDDEPDLQGMSFDPPIFLRLGLAWRKGHYLSAANRAFVDYILADKKVS